jgi:hypothetical protein
MVKTDLKVMDDPQPSRIITVRTAYVRHNDWRAEHGASIVCTAVQDLRELLMLELMLNPATAELIWTLSVSTLLMMAGGLTIWLMPWSDAEILAVHRTVKATVQTTVLAHLPVPLTAPALSSTLSPAPSTRARRPLASA